MNKLIFVLLSVLISTTNASELGDRIKEFTYVNYVSMANWPTTIKPDVRNSFYAGGFTVQKGDKKRVRINIPLTVNKIAITFNANIGDGVMWGFSPIEYKMSQPYSPTIILYTGNQRSSSSDRAIWIDNSKGTKDLIVKSSKIEFQADKTSDLYNKMCKIRKCLGIAIKTTVDTTQEVEPEWCPVGCVVQ